MSTQRHPELLESISHVDLSSGSIEVPLMVRAADPQLGIDRVPLVMKAGDADRLSWALGRVLRHARQEMAS